VSHRIHEPLQSQINNFVSVLYGSVTKIEDPATDSVRWILPCGLGVGLPSNPRGLDEGIACYFLRLMAQVAVENQGPPGLAGLNGSKGSSGFTFTFVAFNTPPVGSSVSIQTAFTPAICPGGNIFVQSSGWYSVISADGLGGIQAVLVKALPGAGVVAPGSAVTPVGVEKMAGPPGKNGIAGLPGIPGIAGPVGTQGPQGPQGRTGNLTSLNGIYLGAGGLDFAATQTAFTPVNFGIVSGEASIQLPQQGKYLILCQTETSSASIGVPLLGGPQSIRLVDLAYPNTPLPSLGMGIILWTDYGTNSDSPPNHGAAARFTYYTSAATTIQMQARRTVYGNVGVRAAGTFLMWILISLNP
jgi:hypothetical protein